MRGDFSFAGTKGRVNALASAGYSFGENGLFSLDLGYRYMSVEAYAESDVVGVYLSQGVETAEALAAPQPQTGITAPAGTKL